MKKVLSRRRSSKHAVASKKKEVYRVKNRARYNQALIQRGSLTVWLGQDDLSFAVSGNPSGSSLSDDAFTWTPGVDDAGTYAVTFSVSDGNGGSDSEEIAITVSDVPDNSDPILASIGDQSVAEGSVLSFTLSGPSRDYPTVKALSPFNMQNLRKA